MTKEHCSIMVNSRFTVGKDITFLESMLHSKEVSPFSTSAVVFHSLCTGQTQFEPYTLKPFFYSYARSQSMIGIGRIENRRRSWGCLGRRVVVWSAMDLKGSWDVRFASLSLRHNVHRNDTCYQVPSTLLWLNTPLPRVNGQDHGER